MDDLLSIDYEIKKRQKQFSLKNWYPDGDLIIGNTIFYAKHKYPKAMDFFKAGNTYRYRLFDGANQCITPWTFIETEFGVVQSLKVFSSTSDRVVSWDGESEGVHPISNGILKCIEPAYRFVMEDKSFFDCTAQHQVLTEQGYLSCDQLVSQSSGLCYWDKVEDYQANCVEDGYLCDQQPLQEEDNDQEQLPSQVGVLKRTLSFSCKDAEERTQKHIRGPLPLALPPTHYTDQQLLDLFEQFSAPAVSQPVLPLRDDSLAYRQSLAVSFHLQSLSELNCDHGQIGIYYPLIHPKLVGGKRIISIVPLGWQPILDATVDKVHNYKAAGVYHHNTGKTSTAAYEVVCHITGLYPDWWEGKRLKGPNKWWIAGETNRDVKEIMQDRLIGPVDERGTGLIPFHCLDFESMTSTDKADTFIVTVRVKHFDENGNFDGMSVLTFKSYEAGRKSFQGLPRNIWLDEEPPLEILSECMARTTSDDDLMLIITFTPLQGWSRMLTNWMPNGWQSSGVVLVNNQPTSKHLTIQTVDDVPHISAVKKKEMYENYHPHVRDARLKGIPSLGSGAIYPIPRSEWVVNDIPIPPHYKKMFGFDVGYNWTAACWLAINPDDHTMYLYSEHKASETEPMGHAEVIRGRGLWIPGAIDSAANGRGQDGGESLINQYTALGLNVTNAVKSVEAGIYAVWSGLKSGQIKVFASCQKTIQEIENYRRDEKGKIVKENDHLCDALRYAIMTKEIAKVQTPTKSTGRIDPRYANQYSRK